MADGDQGFLKVTMTILPENYGVIEEDDDDFDIPEKKRKTYSEGDSNSHESKLTSVKRLILLVLIPQIKESYNNVKFLFDLIQINNIPFRFTADFKLLLIINGQQTATATYPCPYCFVTLGDLKECQNEKYDNESMHLKTYGNLRNNYKKYQDLGSKKKFAKECGSTINPPVFDESDDLPIIQKCIVPELHILQGFVNHLFWDGLVPLIGEKTALLWPKNLNLIPKNYHGNIFQGHALRERY